jgi:hypothetical protein
MTEEPEIRIVKVPVLDTGIGRARGYANDQELIAATEAERERVLGMLTPEARKRIEDAEAEAERRFLFGPDADMGGNEGGK